MWGCTAIGEICAQSGATRLDQQLRGGLATIPTGHARRDVLASGTAGSGFADVTDGTSQTGRLDRRRRAEPQPELRDLGRAVDRRLAGDHLGRSKGGRTSSTRRPRSAGPRSSGRRGSKTATGRSTTPRPTSRTTGAATPAGPTCCSATVPSGSSRARHQPHSPGGRARDPSLRRDHQRRLILIRPANPLASVGRPSCTTTREARGSSHPARRSGTMIKLRSSTVNIPVKDQSLAIAFYTEKLGFAVDHGRGRSARTSRWIELSLAGRADQGHPVHARRPRIAGRHLLRDRRSRPDDRGHVSARWSRKASSSPSRSSRNPGAPARSSRTPTATPSSSRRGLSPGSGSAQADRPPVFADGRRRGGA